MKLTKTLTLSLILLSTAISTNAQMAYDVGVLPTELNLTNGNLNLGGTIYPFQGQYNFTSDSQGLGGSWKERRYTNTSGESIFIRFSNNGSMTMKLFTTNASFQQAMPGDLDQPLTGELTYSSTNRDFNNLTPLSGRWRDPSGAYGGTTGWWNLGYALEDAPMNISTNFANGIGADGNLVGGPVPIISQEENAVGGVFYDAAQELNRGLEFQDGQWVPKP
jgi:hypothetical protein